MSFELPNVNAYLNTMKGDWQTFKVNNPDGSFRPIENGLAENDELFKKINKIYKKISNGVINRGDIVNVFLDKEGEPQLVAAGHVLDDEYDIIYGIAGTKSDGYPLKEYEDVAIDFLKGNKDCDRAEELLKDQERNKRIGNALDSFKEGKVLDKKDTFQLLIDLYPEFNGMHEPFEKKENAYRDELKSLYLQYNSEAARTYKRTLAEYFDCPEQQIVLGDYRLPENSYGYQKRPIVIMGNARFDRELKDGDNLEGVKFIGGGLDISNSEISDLKGCDVRGPISLDNNSGFLFDSKNIKSYFSTKELIKKYCEELFKTENRKKATEKGFDTSKIPDLLDLIIKANKDSILNSFINSNFEVEYIDALDDSIRKASGNLYSRMHAIMPDLAEFFGCDSDEIIIPYGNEFDDTTVISKMKYSGDGSEKTPRVIIGNSDFGSNQLAGISSENINIVIGNLNLSGYHGRLNDDLTVSGNINMDSTTHVDSLGRLFTGGTISGLSKCFSSPEACKEASKNVSYIDRIAYGEPEDLKTLVKEIKERFVLPKDSSNPIDKIRTQIKSDLDNIEVGDSVEGITTFFAPNEIGKAGAETPAGKFFDAKVAMEAIISKEKAEPNLEDTN